MVLEISTGKASGDKRQNIGRPGVGDRSERNKRARREIGKTRERVKKPTSNHISSSIAAAEGRK
jgi:hypothetical protein